MSESGGQAAGWYHAEGDPAGTHRYWDGEMWIGDPQPIGAPSEPTAMSAVSASEGGVAAANLGPTGWYMEAWKNWSDFSGRARRSEYWWFALGNLIISIILSVLGAGVEVIGILSLIFSLVTIIPSLSVGFRRLHDTGRSAWWLLIALIPLIGFIVLIVFMASDSHRGTNGYGPSPKYP